MSKFSEYVKQVKENDIKYFFGDDFKKVSNKYFKFNKIIDDNNIIILTDNVKIIKDNYVLVVDNNKVVYLKNWQVRCCHNYDNGIKTYAVKLNRNFFKTYTFQNDFADFTFAKEETFDDLVKVAEMQQNENMPIALGF